MYQSGIFVYWLSITFDFGWNLPLLITNLVPHTTQILISKLSCSLSNWVTVGNNNSFVMIEIQIIKFVVFYAFHAYLSRWYQLTTSTVFHVFDVVSNHKNCRLWPWHVNYYHWITYVILLAVDSIRLHSDGDPT